MQDFIRYLGAKRSVDDRALNRRVWERLRSELGASEAVRVADVGAGIGAGVERMVEWGLVRPVQRLHCTAVEPRIELLKEARLRLEPLPIATKFVAADLEAFASSLENEGRFDVVVAHALLDILELEQSLETLTRLLRRRGLLYLPITFDGDSIFEPGRAEDESVLLAYHETMESRGSSRAGRRLFHAVSRLGLEVLEIGSSDWIVHPRDRGYPEDEAFFLRFIVRTIEGATSARVSPSALRPWVAERLGQIEAGELFYCAHQIDLLARKRG